MTHIASFLALRRRMPLLDARSPAEFARGHIPGAVSFPLFSDAERAEVGTVYTRTGKREAVLRGLTLVGPKLADMAAQGLKIAGEGEEIALTCWRGGMRSASVAWLLEQTGLTTHLLSGGYKAYRAFCQSIFTRPWSFFVLGGMTGSGKTEVLHNLALLGSQVIDLEGLAQHRGSAFGAWPEKPQPSIEHFENLLADELLALDAARPVWLEDESINLGAVNIPRPLYDRLRASPLVLLHVPRPARLARVLRGYDPARNAFAAEGMDRIRKRLGDENHRKAKNALAVGDYEAAADILLDYYDKAYTKQLKHRTGLAGEIHVPPGESAANTARRLAELEWAAASRP